MVNVGPYAVMLPTVTSTDPDAAPEGTIATICVSLQLWTAAEVPKKSTVPLACDEPKPVPLIVTEEPAEPKLGERPVTESGSTLNWTPLLVIPFCVTVTGPLVVFGTKAVILVSLQAKYPNPAPWILAATPLNRRLKSGCLYCPKPEPVTTTVAPI